MMINSQMRKEKNESNPNGLNADDDDDDDGGFVSNIKKEFGSIFSFFLGFINIVCVCVCVCMWMINGKSNNGNKFESHMILDD